MPIETLLVDGKRYLYFCYYDTAAKRKKRVYTGPASDEDSRKKALVLEGGYCSVQAVKKRILAHLSRLALHHALGDPAAETERLAIAEELESIDAVVSWCPRQSRNRALRERTRSSGRTVKSSILRLVKEGPARYSEIQRELGRPDKTIYVSLKQLLAAGLIGKDRDGAYMITGRGRAALVEEELEETAVDLVEKLGPERAGLVRQWLEELLAEHASEGSCKRLAGPALNLEYAPKDDSRCKPQTTRRPSSALSS